MAPMIRDEDPQPKIAAVLTQIEALNRRFYTEAADSFSATRQRPWPGWRPIVKAMAAQGASTTVLDVACGNLRFEKYLGDIAPSHRWDITAADVSSALLNETSLAQIPGNVTLKPQIVDVLRERDRAKLAGFYDAVTCFGFLHHVPGFTHRAELLRWLIYRARPEGLVAISLWRFESDGDFLARIEPLQSKAAADTGVMLTEAHDWWLPWQNSQGLWRFCHSFTDGEIAELVRTVAPLCTVKQRYDGPGPSDRLNTYLLFQRC